MGGWGARGGGVHPASGRRTGGMEEGSSLKIELKIKFTKALYTEQLFCTMLYTSTLVLASD